MVSQDSTRQPRFKVQKRLICKNSTVQIYCTLVSYISLFYGNNRVDQYVQEVYLDMSIAGEPAGTITIGLFGKIVPETVENFAQLGSTHGQIKVTRF